MNVWVSEIWRAWRASLRRPGFLLLAVAVLGLGVGASATVFTLVDQTLLRPLPFPQSDRLVAMGMDFGDVLIASPREYQHLQSMQGVESTGLVEMASRAVNVYAGGTPLQADALRAGHRLLPTLGVHMALGRNFTAAEDRPHGAPVVLLGHAFWEREYNGIPDVLGQQLQVKGKPYTIIGVLPARFGGFCKRLLSGCDIVLPTALPPGSGSPAPMYRAIARLAPGTPIAMVRAQFDARMQQLVATSGAAFLKHQKFAVTPLATALHARSKFWLNLFMATAAFVLLIAWVNLTNLLFLHALARHHEGAVREALGASGLRRYLPAFAESFLVALCGALVGMALAAAGVSLFGHALSTLMLTLLHLRSGDLHVGGATWGFAFAIAIVAALSATALGLWKGRRFDLGAELHEGGRSGAGPRLSHIGRGLVVVQVALATALLAGAGLFLHAAVGAALVDPGFNAHGVLTFRLTPLKSAYPDRKAVLSLGQRIRQRLAAAPGVTNASVTNTLPVAPRGLRSATGGPGGLWVTPGDTFSSRLAGVDGHHFATLAIPVLKGRAFNAADRRGSLPVAIVNSAFARRHFGGHALGKIVHATRPKKVARRVVGVVGDVRSAGPWRPAPPTLYLPTTQTPWSAAPQFLLRVRGDPNSYRKAVKAVMADVAPMQPIAGVGALQDVLAQRFSPIWFIVLLVGVFAALALLLAGAGIYAVMAVAVASREHEFGVRNALGASPARLMRLVLRDGMLQIAIGLVLGIGAAIPLSRMLHVLLIAIGRGSGFDPLDIVGVCIVLALAGLFACLRPALRAGHVAPMHALRGE